MIRNLASQHISASFQNLLQISGSDVYTGLGVKVDTLNVPVLSGSIYTPDATVLKTQRVYWSGVLTLYDAGNYGGTYFEVIADLATPDISEITINNVYILNRTNFTIVGALEDWDIQILAFGGNTPEAPYGIYTFFDSYHARANGSAPWVIYNSDMYTAAGSGSQKWTLNMPQINLTYPYHGILGTWVHPGMTVALPASVYLLFGSAFGGYDFPAIYNSTLSGSFEIIVEYFINK